MLPSSYRLPAPVFFDVKKKGTLVNGKSVSLSVLKRDDKENSRIGIVVSTKVSKKAVQRNKVKRIIKSFILKNLDAISKGADVAILTRSSILNKVESEIHTDLKQVFIEARLL